jgi:lysyl-tRNA synthetase class 1
VLQVPIVERDAKRGTIVYVDPDSGEKIETTVTGGAVKCQWKADWALRWAALGVDYEMAGKDLIDSVKLSGEIVRALGASPPEGFNYELFLDEKGQKISKSKGNGLTIEEWLTYASPQSLSLFMYQKPREARRLHFDVIPRAVDDYLQFLAGYPKQDAQAAARQSGLAHPCRRIRREPEVLASRRRERRGHASVSFAHAAQPRRRRQQRGPEAVVWGFLRRYAPTATPDTPSAPRRAGRATPIAYYPRFRAAGQTLPSPA